MFFLFDSDQDDQDDKIGIFFNVWNDMQCGMLMFMPHRPVDSASLR